MEARDVALSAVLAALYAGLVVALAPISFYIFQVRVADALLPLSAVLGWPAVVGFTVGCFLGNLAGVLAGMPSGAVLIDATGGSLANFLGCYLAYKLASGSEDKKRLLASTFVITAVVTAIVGTYLPLLLGFPLWMGWLGIFLGSFVSINVMGYLVLLAFLRARLRPSRGIP